MKKKGISLIVLVITIIIIIILAGAVILNLNSNNPVDNARRSNVHQTRDSLRSGINLYMAKAILAENGMYKGSTLILGKNVNKVDASIIVNYASKLTGVVRGKQIDLWQLDYQLVNEKVGIKLEHLDSNSYWCIDEFGNPYLVYDKLSNVAPYLKTEDSADILPSVKDFVVVLEGVEFTENTQPEPEEELTSTVVITKNSNSTATISGFSRNGIKSITYTGPRQGTITPTMNGNYYTAVVNVGNGDYTFTITDNNNETLTKEETISGITTYTVSSVEDLERFRDYVNMGDDFEGVTVTQASDLDLSSVCGEGIGSWTPIGVSSKICFSGIYDGNYHKISNLYMNLSNSTWIGLFRTTKTTSILQNIIMENIYVNNSYSVSDKDLMVGGIVGINRGIIRNCGIDIGTIKGENLTNPTAVRFVVVGGICAMSYGNINNCYNKANVISNTHQTNSNTGAFAAGICTDTWNVDISNCYNAGTVSASGKAIYISGIVSQMDEGSITNCYNSGTISSNSNGKIAGLVAQNGWDSTYTSGSITNSYCTTDSTYSSYDMNSSNSSRRVSSNTLKGYTSILGDAYKEDTNNINNGYPILAWE